MQAIQDILDNIHQKYPNEPDFHQAVTEVFEDVIPYIQEHDTIEKLSVLERLVEPDRILQFRVAWQNQKGGIEVNRGWRVQYNNAIGPYKGGLRFHPSVSLDTFKFLGFEQTFKNALTGLQMGGGKGGSDFDSKGRSDADVMSFCHAFMLELHKHIGPDYDVPAGDIGVGGREIGYMFGMYKKLSGRFDGALTGKSPSFGGSLIRKEATGYGTVYFLENALNHAGEDLKGKTCAISGAGNVALYTAQKLIEKGAKVVSLSDSKGTLYLPDGMSQDQLATLIDLKEIKRGRLSEFDGGQSNFEYRAGKEPWEIECDIALPCATQNEISDDEAKSLIKNGAKWVAEGANMPTTAKAVKALHEAGVSVLPSKAVNAGGVSVSGLERTQNATYLSWTSEEVDKKLQDIMKNIHDICAENSVDQKQIHYGQGANIAGFKRVAEAMMAYGSL
jgi:glutamate dehydrogenase (NADP+)